MAKIKVSKIDAACRQIECAIKLWLSDGDPVSVCTLAYAALEITNDLNKKRGNREITLEYAAELHAKPGYKEVFIKYIKAPMNFFKHANRDPDSILEFDPAGNEFTLLFAIKGYAELGHQISEVQDTFIHWLLLHRPNLLKEGETLYPQLRSDQIEELKAMPKRQFFEQALRIRTLQRAKIIS